MPKRFVLLLVLSLAAIVPAPAQSNRGPSTQEERTKALAAIDDLEKNPLGPNAKEERRWLTMWLIEVPDIHVGFCTDLIPERTKIDKDDGAILSTQLMFSGAGYAIQHPGSTSSDPGQYFAGMQGSLRVYEALLTQKPKVRQPALDDLVNKRDAGTLETTSRYRSRHTAKSSGVYDMIRVKSLKG